MKSALPVNLAFVVGDSRTGKTIACETYRLKHPPILIAGQLPHIPVVSWQSPPESGNRDLLEGILQALRYQLNRGTLSEIRSRVYRTLKACQVEMLIVDEAHRLRPRTFSELQDILDGLQIAIVLVGTDTRFAQATPPLRCSNAARRTSFSPFYRESSV